MKINIHITNSVSGISQRDMFISGFMGIGDSFMEIFSLGKISTDLRYQWALHCARKKVR